MSFEERLKKAQVEQENQKREQESLYVQQLALVEQRKDLIKKNPNWQEIQRVVQNPDFLDCLAIYQTKKTGKFQSEKNRVEEDFSTSYPYGAIRMKIFSGWDSYGGENADSWETFSEVTVAILDAYTEAEVVTYLSGGKGGASHKHLGKKIVGYPGLNISFKEDDRQSSAEKNVIGLDEFLDWMAKFLIARENP